VERGSIGAAVKDIEGREPGVEGFKRIPDDGGG
jgi:hypothetical protein